MLLTSLSLNSFRNYKKCNFKFSPEITVIIGPNATGKTNILEAISLLSTGKSFKADKQDQIVHYDKEVAIVAGKEKDVIYEIVTTRGVIAGQKVQKKKYMINGVTKRSIDFVGHIKSVLFWPEDLDLVTDSPALRRRYLNNVLIQVDMEYRRRVKTYEKVMRQRNRLLESIREGQASLDQLGYWDEILISAGQYITKKRQEYVHYVNSYWKVRDEKLNIFDKGGFDLSIYEIEYDKSVISADRLKTYQEAEIASATTLVGPHRDDIIFYKTDKGKQRKDRKNLSHFGSRGEQRLGVLWLKLGELQYIYEKTSTKPILLLDDIFSELDSEHRQFVYTLITQQQTIITTTDINIVLPEVRKTAGVITLE